MNDWNMYEDFRTDQQMMPQQAQPMPQMMPGDCGCGTPVGPMWPQMPFPQMPQQMPQMMPGNCGCGTPIGPMWPQMPFPQMPQQMPQMMPMPYWPQR